LRIIPGRAWEGVATWLQGSKRLEALKEMVLDENQMKFPLHHHEVDRKCQQTYD
jgi:hypothetical protein